MPRRQTQAAPLAMRMAAWHDDRVIQGATLPQFGRSTLAEVLPSVAAHLACRDAADTDDATDALGLPDGRRYVLCLIDGLGWDLLGSNEAAAPTLFAALTSAIPLTAAVPSTTATSLVTLGTGSAPGRHGFVGFTFRWRPGRIMSPLSWRGGPRDAIGFQAISPWWQLLAERGIAVSAVGPSELMGTRFTIAALRGARYVPFDDETDAGLRVEQIAQAARAGSSSLVYAYERGLDRAGHHAGCGSRQWRDTLSWVDRLVTQLRGRLDPDVHLLVTGDHGMVDVPPDHRLWCDDDPKLMDGVDLLAGEARFRHVYTSRPEAVASAWRDRLGERAMVVLGDQAVAEGWFGDVEPAMRPQIGDVLAVARDDWAMLSRRMPGEADLVGMHGGLTHAEMAIPLLVFPGQE